MGNEIKDIWDNYWLNNVDKNSFFGRLCKLSRKYIEANTVSHYLEKYFNKNGVFVECGCGTSETSRKLSKKEQLFIGLDISHITHAQRVPQINCVVNADIIELPFRDDSIDGIWNLGVMEHFTLPEIYIILDEMYRVLKKRGHLILFWPHRFSPLSMLLNYVESFVNSLFDKNLKFYPEEPTRLPSSRRKAKEIFLKTRFSECELYFSYKNVFNNLIVVLKK